MSGHGCIPPSRLRTADCRCISGSCCAHKRAGRLVLESKRASRRGSRFLEVSNSPKFTKGARRGGGCALAADSPNGRQPAVKHCVRDARCQLATLRWMLEGPPSCTDCPTFPECSCIDSIDSFLDQVQYSHSTAVYHHKASLSLVCKGILRSLPWEQNGDYGLLRPSARGPRLPTSECWSWSPSLAKLLSVYDYESTQPNHEI